MSNYSEHIWAMRGKFLFSLLREREVPGNRSILQIDDLGIGPELWVKPEGTEKDWLEAIDECMRENCE